MNSDNQQTARPAVERKRTLDDVELKKLERQLQQRPDKSELMERNILKDDRVAPGLQAAKEKLERSQLEDKLGHALQQRPTPDELVKEGILQADAMPPPS